MLLKNIVDGLLYRDFDPVAYRPEFNRFTGSVTATLFLQQVYYYYTFVSKGQPFYKFNAPCKHVLYLKGKVAKDDKPVKTGDSWEERLGFTKNKLIEARDKVSFKVTPSTIPPMRVFDDNDELLPVYHLVYYWTDLNNVTHYLLNEPLFYAYIILYCSKDKEGEFVEVSLEELKRLMGIESEKRISENPENVTPRNPESGHPHIQRQTENPYLDTKPLGMVVPKNEPDEKEKKVSEFTALEQFILDLNVNTKISAVAVQRLNTEQSLTENGQTVMISANQLYDDLDLYREWVNEYLKYDFEKRKHKVSGRVAVNTMVDSLVDFKNFQMWVKQTHRSLFKKIDIIESDE